MGCLRIVVFAVLIANNVSVAQTRYQLTGRQYHDSIAIPDYDGLSFIKGYQETVRVYNKVPDSMSSRLTITDLNINSFSKIASFSITDSRINFSYMDILATKERDIFIGNNCMYIYNRAKKTSDFIEKDTVMYDRGYSLNDSLILLSSIFNYHPLDGFPGVHLTVFNLNNKKIIKHIKKKFYGIALSHMINDWVYCKNENIYVVQPLSGNIYKFNNELNLVDSSTIPIRWDSIARNTKYQDSTNFVIYRNYFSTTELVNNYGADSVKRNRKFSVWKLSTKEFIHNIIKQTRENYEYIEKIIPFDDSTVIVSVSRPGYNLKYRDVYYYNPEKNMITGRYEKWLCGREDTLNVPEDFFSVDIINSNPYMPFFYKNKAYALAVYNPLLFVSGTRKNLSEILYNSIVNQNYVWRVLEYKL